MLVKDKVLHPSLLISNVHGNPRTRVYVKKQKSENILFSQLFPFGNGSFNASDTQTSAFGILNDLTERTCEF